MNQPIPDIRSAPDEPSDADRRVSAWSLIKPYWISEEWKVAWALLVTIIVMNLTQVGISVWFNDWYQKFYNALQTRNLGQFEHLLLQFTPIAFVSIAIYVYRVYLQQMLEFKWRQWLTHNYLREWLGERAFYRIERDQLADNPDQRISVDLQGLASSTLSLSLGLLSQTATLFSFIVILWTVAGPLTLKLANTVVTIPGYMVWASALWAIGGSYITYKIGRPLISINYQQQRVEADFRFGLIRVRENSEQIAFYDGVQTENANAQNTFERIRINWWRIMEYTKRLNLTVQFYGQASLIFPFVLASPRYFSGALTLGVLMRLVDAFNTVSNSFSWFINNYGTLVDWKATVNRLREFQRVMHSTHLKESILPATEHGGILFHYADENALRTTNLFLALPNGAALASIGNVAILPGSRWLVRGPSGAGKSTLMRALAGLWPFGDGAIDAPVGARMMFVPQQSYLPIGTLKAALAYPAAPEAFSDDACRDALRASGLDDYADRLAESGHWTRILSPGEQQRLAGARVLLHKPDYLFLDEATSALDPDNEARLYRIFNERLPKAAIVSIAHRDSLAVFHNQTLDVRRESDKVAA